MRIKQWLFSAILLMGSIVGVAQNRDTSFAKEWLQIDSLIEYKQLNKTALQKVEELYKKTKESNNTSQRIKLLMYRYYLEQKVTDNNEKDFFALIIQEIKASTDPVSKSVLTNIFARYMEYYYTNQRWRIDQRNNTTVSDTTNDLFNIEKIDQWSGSDYNKRIDQLYIAALEPVDLLQKTPLAKINAVILGDIHGETIFDLLAHSAIDHFKYQIRYTRNNRNDLNMNDPALFASLDQFLSFVFITKDNSGKKWWTLQVYKQLLSVQKKNNHSALLLTDLERLNWVYQESTLYNKATLYEKALNDIIAQYASSPHVTEAYYQLASIYADASRNYQPFGDTSHRYGFRTAKKIIEQYLPAKPDSSNPGIAKMLNLLNEICYPMLSTNTELVNLPNQPFRTLVNFKNIDTLSIRIIKITPSVKSALEKYRKDNMNQDILNTIIPYRSWTQPLPSTNNDHQTHAAEISVPALPIGNYLIYCSSNKNFSAIAPSSVQSFHVSAISYFNDERDLFVMHRETGKPLGGVSIVVRQNVYQTDKRMYNSVIVYRGKTNQQGYYKIGGDDNNNVRWSNTNYKLEFIWGKDTLAPDESQYIMASNYASNAASDRDISEQIHFFTDRGIYRPGQTVSYKGIITSGDLITGLPQIKKNKEFAWIYLFNSTGKRIDSAKHSLNTYGSFTGSFKLPVTENTGNFYIANERQSNRANFSVEEYKRPSFSINFNDISEAYRLNDSIILKGKVTAYAGNNIDHAKVRYQVTRNTIFRPLTYRKGIMPTYMGEQNIIAGESLTDTDGSFTIRYKAVSDEQTDLNTIAMFRFTTRVDITDIAGETRSAQKDITIGAQSINLTILTPNQIDSDSLKFIGINASNYNNQPAKANVSLTIFELESPKRLIRERLWQRPDLFTMTQQEYYSKFPFDEYDQESLPENWKRGKILFTDSLQINGENKFNLLNQQWRAGAYLVIASALDKDGKRITTEQIILLHNSKKQQNAVPKAFIQWGLLNNVQPGQQARFLFSTDIPKIYIIQKNNGPKGRNAIQYLERTKGFQTIDIDVTEKDRGGFQVSEAFVYQNRMYTYQMNIDVPWKNKELQVEYRSFRNKVEPGQQEKWEILVKSDSILSKDAELLTSMYDASLDQFRNFNWLKPNLWTNNRFRLNNFNSYANFRLAYSNNKLVPYINVPVNYNNNRPMLADNAAELVRLNLYGPIISEVEYSKVFEGPLPPPVTRDFAMSSSALNEVVMARPVTESSPGASSKIAIRGNSAFTNNDMVYIVNGEITYDISDIDPQDIENATILRGSEATSLYGSRAANGAIVISGKGGKKPTPPPVVPRRNFNETAFFYPQVYADSAGTYTISFTVPDALTKWKWQSFAHTKDLAMGLQSTSIVSQRTLMVQANASRFLREGDKMEFSGKISNMSDKELSGQVTLELIDATTGTSVDGWFQNMFPTQYFTVEAGQSSPVKFPIQIPFSYNKPLTWRLVARAGNFSDGEENILPVLSNRELVIESMPLLLLKDTVQSFSFDKLIKANSPSLTHQSLTINYTANPIWEAIRALPYLMEYPYECAEQSFNRFYANAIGSYIVNKNPKIKNVLTAWLKDSTALKGKLSSNQVLKQILLEETPWVLEAHNEAEQQAQLAALLDLIRMDEQTKLLIDKLNQLQSADGSFSWFKGGSPNPYMTNYILTGIGKLKRIGAITPNIAIQLRSTIEKAMAFMDQHMNNELTWLKKNHMDTARSPLSGSQIAYLYMRSFFRDMAPDKQGEAYRFFYDKGKQTLTKQSLYEQALLGMVYYRNNEKRLVNANILPVVFDNAVEDKKQGTIYWKDRSTYGWYGNPIEHQSTLIQFMQEVQQEQYFAGGKEKLAMARNWLLMNKQTNHWNTTIATADACYSLLVTGNDAAFNDRKVRIQVGDRIISNDKKAEAGTGFFTETIEGRFVQPTMGNVKVSVSTTGAKEANTLNTSWGSINWQYFEDMDKISSSTGNPLSVSKQLFREISKGSDRVLEPVQENDVLHPGDKVVVRMVISSTKDIEYVHLKDTRASSMEPVNVLSSYKWQDGLGYYESTRDASTNFFFDQLRKGKYVFDYPVFITHLGTFSTGVASIQCMYAPEFNAHSGGTKIRVEE
jgi:TonB-dependent SusC/RagA subfamily outer membrane receptor